jgi:hypothetical protein
MTFPGIFAEFGRILGKLLASVSPPAPQAGSNNVYASNHSTVIKPTIVIIGDLERAPEVLRTLGIEIPISESRALPAGEVDQVGEVSSH